MSMNAVSSSINVKMSVHATISVEPVVMTVIIKLVPALIPKRTMITLNVPDKEMPSTTPVSTNVRLVT